MYDNRLSARLTRSGMDRWTRAVRVLDLDLHIKKMFNQLSNRKIKSIVNREFKNSNTNSLIYFLTHDDLHQYLISKLPTSCQKKSSLANKATYNFYIFTYSISGFYRKCVRRMSSDLFAQTFEPSRFVLQILWLDLLLSCVTTWH